MNFYRYILPVIFLGIGLSANATTTSSVSTFEQFTGEAAGDMAGTSVKNAGDVNGDGFADFLVGSYLDDDGGSNAGAGYLIYGQATQFSGTISLSSADAKFVGEAATDHAAFTLSAAGDLNNDGYDDFLIATLLDDYGYVGASIVYLYYGSTTQYSGTTSLSAADVILEADVASGSGSFIPLFTGGDINGDGYDDLFIATYHEASNYSGVVYVLYGEAAAWSGTIRLTSADAQFIAEASSDAAGFSYALGDINADGFDDLVIGAPDEDSAGSYAGAAYVVWGSAVAYNGTINLANADLQYTGEATSDRAGSSVTVADTNGDDFVELIMGAAGNDDASTGAGAVYFGYLYIDSDGDNVGGSDGLISGTDCDDHDSSISVEQTYYLDADADGLGDPSVSLLVCASSAPAGYVSNADDMDDTIVIDVTPPAEITLGAISKDPWNKTIILNWTNPTDSDFDHVQIVRTDQAGTDVIVATDETGETYTDNSIDYNMRYTYTLFSVDTTGNVSTGVTTPVKKVRNPSVRHLHLISRDTAIVASWKRLPLRHNPAVGYVVYYGIAPDALTTAIDVGNTKMVTIPALVSGELYYVAVAAYNGDGAEGPLSTIKSIQL